MIASCWLLARDHSQRLEATWHPGHVVFLIDPLTTWKFTSLKALREKISRVILLERQYPILYGLLM